MKKDTFIRVLREFGLKRMPWDKCVKGFKESNYPCYSDEKNNRYCEVYLGDKLPYVWIVGNGIKPTQFPGGLFFDDPADLRKLLSSLNPTNP